MTGAFEVAGQHDDGDQVEAAFEQALPPVFGNAVGAALVLFSASILVPLPATNTVPGFAVVIVAMGLLQRDGILVLIGSALGTAWIATLLIAGASLASLIKAWLGL